MQLFFVLRTAVLDARTGCSANMKAGLRGLNMRGH